MEGCVVHWMYNGILDIKHNYKELEQIQTQPPTNLWDVFRVSILLEDILPMLRRKIRKHQKELHALTCTCKDAYTNGHPKIKNNIRRIRQTGG